MKGDTAQSAKDREANDSRNAVGAPVAVRNGEVRVIQYHQHDVVGRDAAQWKVWQKRYMQLIFDARNTARSVGHTRKSWKMQLRGKASADDGLVRTCVKNPL
jgi:hypothetical protein